MDGKPVVLDDTSYSVPCHAKSEAEYIESLLNSPVAGSFFEALIFWDAKRPITIDLLDSVDFLALARELGSEATMAKYLARQQRAYKKCARAVQGELFST